MGDLFTQGAGTPGADVLVVEGLTGHGLSDISFTVRAGEIEGVFGLVGSGVETLGRSLYGVLGPLESGRVTFAGQAFRPTDPRQAKAAGVGFVAAERKKEGIIGELTVRENMALPFQERFVSGLFVSRAQETAHAEHWIRSFSIRSRGPEQKIRTLSGGNQQKVCLARWLVDGVKLLILEEPTRGVDMGARREIYARLRELADDGFAVLVLSSDVEEIAGLSDRSLVLDRGRVVGRFDRGTTPAALMAATVGHPPTKSLEVLRCPVPPIARPPPRS